MNQVLAGGARVLVRLCVPLAAMAVSAAVLSAHFEDIPHGVVLDGVLALPPERLLLALVLVLLAFVAVAGQERAVMAHLSIRILTHRGRMAAAATAAVSQMVGFGPFVGAVVRRRLLPELSLVQSFRVSVGITVGFFVGLALLWMVFSAATTGRGGAPVALAVPVGAAGLSLGLAFLARRHGIGLRVPNLIVTARFLGWLTVDLLALGTLFWLVIPDPALPLAEVLPVFLLALGAGFLSGSPAGAGLFEATVVTRLPQVSADDMVAGIILFRLIAFALPAVCGAAFACLAPWLQGQGPAQEPAPRCPPPQDLPFAEAGLVHQGELALIAPSPGVAWLSGALPHTRVVIGDPLPGPLTRAERTGVLRALRHLAWQEGRLTCLYKCSPRLAATARRNGFRVLPVAREAVIDPITFTLAGPSRAGLRRKLNHASKSGITAVWTAAPPMADLAEVAADWYRRHGGERGFSMGRWNPSAVRHQAVFLARDAEGRVLAFVTFHVSATEWTLDLIRCRDTLPDGTTYALVACALDAARGQGIRRLSLAAVPEAAFAGRGPLAAAIRRRACGLLQFKSAFSPRWERRFIAAPGLVSLVMAAAEIGLAVMFPARVRVGRTAAGINDAAEVPLRLWRRLRLVPTATPPGAERPVTVAAPRPARRKAA